MSAYQAAFSRARTGYPSVSYPGDSGRTSEKHTNEPRY